MTGWVRPSGCAAGDRVEARTSPAFPGKVIELRRVKSNTMVTGVLTMTRAEFAAHITAAKNGKYDNLIGETS